MFHDNPGEKMEGWGKAAMWMHMPKDVKLAKLEMKKQILEAKLEFLGKMIERTKNMPDEKK